ncbi:Dam family site-specific DNA-(adenine-N6)-methyltransferase [Pseudomonas sp.]|uniref:DNA adenine methylase n=1 Tax=Pseudomonas sp. TaxID=306 RepID=UPI002736C65B|nr:Dam family site-specific DNA-(adenine-N6)-methyltransferase [Pseudomonas sp.]MDP2746440.1 Dam family site-specific DNA-(adenine-N6)-methyltransferase [Pseudomonas sp.]
MLLDSLQTISIIPAMILTSTLSPKPFIKWAGGKQALAHRLFQAFPADFERFYEPFVGGGSVFLSLSPHKAIIGDQNQWLIDTYRAIQDSWEEVASVLDTLPNTKEDFLRIRKMLPASLSLTERAAHFIYLNKTCFRGLFRVNQKGQFNVPYGEYDRRYYDPFNLEAVSFALQETLIRPGDFERALFDVSCDDFVYLDPPYYKLGGHSDFNRYTEMQFREQDHLRLAALCRELDVKGVKWAVSNSNTVFVRHIFAGFNIQEITARREINLNSQSRNIIELLITNY